MILSNKTRKCSTKDKQFFDQHFHPYQTAPTCWVNIRPPTEILEVGEGAGRGTNIRVLDDILGAGRMSLDVLDSDIKASSPENIHYRHSNFIEVTLCH